MKVRAIIASLVSGLVSGVVGAVLVACPRPPEEPPAPAADASSISKSPDATIDAAGRAIDAGPIAAWTDPAAVDELMRSCAFDPNADDGGAPKNRAFLCAVPFEQSCVIDPCI